MTQSPTAEADEGGTAHQNAILDTVARYQKGVLPKPPHITVGQHLHWFYFVESNIMYICTCLIFEVSLAANHVDGI